MQPARRRPLGDIGNTLGNHLVSVRDNKPKPAEQPKPRSALTLSLSPRADDKHRQNPLFVTEYVKEIFEYFRKAETKNRPTNTYMAVQTDINEKMRAILVDWLVDVHLKFKLLPETLFLAVELVDRFLDKKIVSRQTLQLVGVVGMLLGAKYEEIYPPEVKDFIYIAANTYTREDILRMERLVFQTLDFNLTFPTIFVFLRRGLQIMEADTKTCQMAQYLAESCLVDYKMLGYSPSLVGASCILVANKILGNSEPWSSSLEHYTTYKLSQMDSCVEDIYQLARNAPNNKTQAVRKKYSYAKYGEVSKLPIASDIH